MISRSRFSPFVFGFVRQSGFEPETLCLEGRCSIQLSYWRFQDVTKVGK